MGRKGGGWTARPMSTLDGERSVYESGGLGKGDCERTLDLSRFFAEPEASGGTEVSPQAGLPSHWRSMFFPGAPQTTLWAWEKLSWGPVCPQSSRAWASGLG